MMVDGHLHLFRPANVLPRVVDELAPAERDAPVEELVEEQDRLGVDAAVMVPLGPEDHYLGEVLRRFPRRFAGIAVANGATEGRKPGGDPVGALRRRRESVPFHGVRFRWIGEPGQPLEGSPAWPVLRRMATDGLVLWSYLPEEQLGLLEQLVRALPDLPVVLNHLGFCPRVMQVDAARRPRFNQPIPPPTLPRVVKLARWPQVHLMFSGQYAFSRTAPPYHDLDVVVRPLLEAFGAARTLWASDWPWIRDQPGYARLLTLPGRIPGGASPSELEDLLGGTTRRLFPHLVPTAKE